MFVFQVCYPSYGAITWHICILHSIAYPVVLDAGDFFTHVRTWYGMLYDTVGFVVRMGEVVVAAWSCYLPPKFFLCPNPIAREGRLADGKEVSKKRRGCFLQSHIVRYTFFSCFTLYYMCSCICILILRLVVYFLVYDMYTVLYMHSWFHCSLCHIFIERQNHWK